MTYATAAYLAEQTRASVLENLDAPWVNTARMKGLGERAVLVRHVLRNALIPVVTVSALALPAVFTGSVFLEKIFSIEGIGWTLVQAVEERDHPVVMAITTVAAGLTLAGLTLADLLYAAVDPRIRFE
jgi:peptide/nickel transport system permease protein